MSIRSIATAFINLLLAIAIACVNHCWTKSSIEDLSIKEVRPKTIIWTMLKNGGRYEKRKPLISMKSHLILAAPRRRKTVCQGIEI